MQSKYQFDNSPVYIEGTDVPHNKLGITDSDILHELEGELISEAYLLLAQELDDSTVFDEAYFKDLHRRTLESLYEWAGVYRDFNMSKGESRFCDGDYVESYSKKIFNELEKEHYLQALHLSKEEWVKKVAYFKCELIALHPFYELNGRITRLFFDMIALHNGYDCINYSDIDQSLYIQASISCVQQADCKLMEEIITTGLKS